MKPTDDVKILVPSEPQVLESWQTVVLADLVLDEECPGIVIARRDITKFNDTLAEKLQYAYTGEGAYSRCLYRCLL